jgi:hypothetical protein
MRVGALRLRTTEPAPTTLRNPRAVLSRSSVVTGNPHKQPNPQGKGLVPVLGDWAATRPRGAASKPPARLLLDWFASLLVLSARFNFRPVAETPYHLYLRHGEWRLSLVAPGQWGDRDPGACLGECRLRRDMTWSLQLRDRALEDPQLAAALERLVDSFLRTLDGDADLDTLLPGYRRDLGYYRRLLATGLGASLRQSLAAGDRLRGSPRELLRSAGPDALRIDAPGRAAGAGASRLR